MTDYGNVFMTGPEALIMGRIAAICGAALIPLLIRWLYRAVRHKDGMGLGDVKLLAMIAAFLGFWPAVLAFFFGAGGFGEEQVGSKNPGETQCAKSHAETTEKLATGLKETFRTEIVILAGFKHKRLNG